MIARNKRRVRAENGTELAPSARNRRKFVRVLVSYRAELRGRAFRPFYVSNTPVAATCAAEAIRAHCRIENTSHYSRDVTLGEDRSRIRTNPGVFARLRSFAFNILKANQTNTLTQDRYRASLAGTGKLLRMLAVLQR